MKNKIIIISIIISILLLCGCSTDSLENTQEYKEDLLKEYPAYNFVNKSLIYMRYPSINELKSSVSDDVSFITTDKILPFESISFKYINTDSDKGVKAIDEKLKDQGIDADNDISIYPYEIIVNDIYGEKDINGKTILLIGQYFSEMPKIEGTMGILVSTDVNVPSMWADEYEKVYPKADTYVYLVHPELSYYYVSEDDTVVPMCNQNIDDYNSLVGLTLDEFEQIIK